MSYKENQIILENSGGGWLPFKWRENPQTKFNNKVGNKGVVERVSYKRL